MCASLPPLSRERERERERELSLELYAAPIGEIQTKHDRPHTRLMDDIDSWCKGTVIRNAIEQLRSCMRAQVGVRLPGHASTYPGVVQRAVPLTPKGTAVPPPPLAVAAAPPPPLAVPLTPAVTWFVFKHAASETLGQAQDNKQRRKALRAICEIARSARWHAPQEPCRADWLCCLFPAGSRCAACPEESRRPRSGRAPSTCPPVPCRTGEAVSYGVRLAAMLHSAYNMPHLAPCGIGAHDIKQLGWYQAKGTRLVTG